MTNFRVTDKRLKYENPWMRVYEYAIARGEAPGIYGVVDRPNSSVIVVASPAGRTVLLKQFRFPTEAHGWEFPMGNLDVAESAADSASRELLEETGLSARHVRQVGEFHPIPGLTPQSAAVFIAEVDDGDLTALTATPASAVDEILERRVVTFGDLKEMIVAGEITDGFTLCAYALAHATATFG